ncbi:MAG: hypothetical protein GY847_25520 [Proteobacteria bacterium]|nr:hypothetical protein [Pseudomonadota bacterium]
MNRLNAAWRLSLQIGSRALGARRDRLSIDFWPRKAVVMLSNYKLEIVVILAALVMVSTRARADDSSETEFAWLSFAPEIGYIHFFEAVVDSPLDARVSARNGVIIKGHVDIGGDGIALEIAPLYARESGGGLFGDFNVLGGEVTLVFRASTGSFYPGVGIGFHGAYIFRNNYINSGSELYGRIPLGFTWYFFEYLGLVFEAGVMYGGTGVRAKRTDEDNPRDDNKRAWLAESGKPEFGAGFAFDILVGLRFP